MESFQEKSLLIKLHPAQERLLRKARLELLFIFEDIMYGCLTEQLEFKLSLKVKSKMKR